MKRQMPERSYSCWLKNFIDFKKLNWFRSANVRSNFHICPMNDLVNRLNNPPSPLQEVQAEAFSRKGLRLFVKRDDLLHPHISGNKWRKLKYNLLEARRLGHKRLITFGGAYSNHLVAVAAAGVEFGFSTLGVVRGERVLPLNPTLKYVEMCGMELAYVSRANFRNKTNLSILEDLKINFNNSYILPEGGTNCLALPGCAELVEEIQAQLGSAPDFLCTACGTGGTLAGLVSGLQHKGTAIGVSALKGDFLKNEVASLLKNCSQPEQRNWRILTDYHFGGYARFTPELIGFINRFHRSHGIPLDPVYTGKLFYGIFDLAENGFFKEGDTVVLVHTGGLQGITGFVERFPNAGLLI